MISTKQTTSLIALIYHKQLKVSAATNKKFTQGEVVNFVQVDAAKLVYAGNKVVYLTRYPFIIAVCFTLLFHYLGLSFFSGVATFIIAFSVNAFLTSISVRL